MPGMSLGMGTFLGGLATGIGSMFGGSQQSSAAPTNIPGQQNLTPGQQFAGSAGQAIGAAGGDWLSNMIAERQQDRQMKKASKNQIDSTRKYFNELFPNTNEWERLGASSPAGAQITSANMQARSAERVANIQARTARDVALIQTSPQHRQAQVSESRLRSEVENLDAGTKHKLAQAIESAASGRLYQIDASTRDALNRAGITQRQFSSWRAGVATMAKETGREWENLSVVDKISMSLGYGSPTEVLFTDTQTPGFGSRKYKSLGAPSATHWSDTGVRKNR